MPTYTVELYLENGELVKVIRPASSIMQAILAAIDKWIRQDETIVQINAYEEMED